jgi:hypothetical protein
MHKKRKTFGKSRSGCANPDLLPYTTLTRVEFLVEIDVVRDLVVSGKWYLITGT